MGHFAETVSVARRGDNFNGFKTIPRFFLRLSILPFGRKLSSLNRIPIMVRSSSSSSSFTVSISAGEVSIFGPFFFASPGNGIGSYGWLRTNVITAGSSIRVSAKPPVRHIDGADARAATLSMNLPFKCSQGVGDWTRSAPRPGVVNSLQRQIALNI